MQSTISAPLGTLTDVLMIPIKGDLTFFNCTWFGSDGVATSFSGRNVELRNNLWELNDWSGANNDFFTSGGIGTIYSGKSKKETFIRNTMRYRASTSQFKFFIMRDRIIYQCISKNRLQNGNFLLLFGDALTILRWD